ncbi:MAG: hypothetical protein WCA22_21620 [Candidatus Binatus sp.]
MSGTAYPPPSRATTRKAKFVVYLSSLESKTPASAQRLKVLRAVESLLPQGDDARQEAYARGYQNGAADERRKE